MYPRAADRAGPTDSSRPGRIGLIVGVLAVSVSIGCSHVAGAVASKGAQYTHPWTLACDTVNLALKLNHTQRQTQIATLSAIGSAPGAPVDLKAWLTRAEKVLRASDLTTLSPSDKKVLDQPCAAHDASISSLKK